ncbi:MAG: phosphatidylinositol-specific phospholipase C/glycerophosphodiester phosphodiesterase family protein [Gemmatimonadota bacterium]|nr:phosphatidylinositol-specific phospholipase C/glycerophosphodiester phosphodiesterase family protein [Gemmatimonadota bacterium]
MNTGGANTARAHAVVRIALAVTVLCATSARAQAVLPLEHAHAHNDYEHTRPLMEALEHGFTSVEADIYLVHGQLLVAHDSDKVDPARTLESLYLDPLRAIIRQHGGSVFGTPYPLTLLIDIKSDSQSTYVALDSVLRRYADILTIFADTIVIEGPIVAIMSGERALGTVRSSHVRFAALDGRLVHLDSSRNFPARVMPLISDNWDRVTKWKGKGTPPTNLRADLERIVTRAHRQGQRVRFWATPDTDAVWTMLRTAGVDLIGADDLDALRHFMLHGNISPAP